MNKRVFCCGFFFGVLLTWILSFYLYYSLNNPSSLKVYRDLHKNIFNVQEEDESGENDNSEEFQLDDNSIEDHGAKSSYVKGKEKVKKKYSQSLIDELTPVTIKQLREFGIIKTVEDQVVRDEGYKTHAFNILVSNQIGVIRDIPDTRNKV